MPHDYVIPIYNGGRVKLSTHGEEGKLKFVTIEGQELIVILPRGELERLAQQIHEQFPSE